MSPIFIIIGFIVLYIIVYQLASVKRPPRPMGFYYVPPKKHWWQKLLKKKI
jgi:hypothetical protein